ncbi:AAA family ATPase, partial [Peptostreptococcus faecalis]|uniref:AAA family ATPase n=1 Tax=Peptostreptococcus faecalis TaxID=2045015 RepID=UPI0011AFADAD
MAFKPSIKKVAVDITQLRIYIRGVKKWGKTDLCIRVGKSVAPNPGEFLYLGTGVESGDSLQNNLFSSHIQEWNDLKELMDWLTSEDEDAKKVKMICLDTVDELIPIVEKEVCESWERKSRKPCSSINEAYGGFGRGQAEACSLIKKLFFDIHRMGIGIMVIGHTKLKTVIDKGNEGTEGYQILTSNLQGNYESVFSDIFDCVLTGVIDRDIQDGVATQDARKLYFRGNTRVDAGCRFIEDSIPEYMIYDGRKSVSEFIGIIEKGMR